MKSLDREKGLSDFGKTFTLGLQAFQVLRRLKAMNRRLEKEIGQYIAEKRGHHWALTSFARETWGETERSLKGESQ